MAKKINEKIVGFLELPPEIRNRIYRYCLSVRGQLELKPEHYLSEHTTRFPDEKIMRSLQTPRDIRPVLSDINRELDAAILFTCRHVYAEAFEVLYGTNVFFVQEHAAAMLCNMGPNMRFIRHIRFGPYTKQKDLDKSLRLMRCCQDLDRVILMCWSSMGTGRLKKIIGPTLRFMDQERQGENQKEAIDIFELENSRGDTDRSGNSADDNVMDLLSTLPR